MTSIETWQYLAHDVQALFVEQRGDLHEEDFIAVAGLLGFDARPHRPPRSMLKPLARNYLAEVFSTNLTHVLETYEWGDLRPLTTDGVTVAGFWDSASAPSPPAGYRVAGSATR